MGLNLSKTILISISFIDSPASWNNLMGGKLIAHNENNVFPT